MTHYKTLYFVTHCIEVFFMIITFNTDYFSTQLNNIDVYNGEGCVPCKMDTELLSIIYINYSPQSVTFENWRLYKFSLKSLYIVNANSVDCVLPCTSPVSETSRMIPVKFITFHIE